MRAILTNVASTVGASASLAKLWEPLDRYSRSCSKWLRKSMSSGMTKRRCPEVTLMVHRSRYHLGPRRDTLEHGCRMPGESVGYR
jgi:hypothetical protein